MSRSTVLIVGGAVVDAGAGPAIGDLARRTRTGVLNTWRAKGLFRFDDPAHLGTIGLQRDDLLLAGVAGEQRSFDRVVACGVADGELPDGVTVQVFDSVEAFEAHMTESDFPAMMDDLEQFLDTSSIGWVLCDEPVVVLGGSGPE